MTEPLNLKTSKVRRIKNLLSSFLTGDSREDGNHPKDKSEAGLQDTSADSSTVVIEAAEGDVEELPSKDGEPSSTVQPMNRQAFFRRVETFSTSTWFAKPEGVSPLRCAQFGWENIDVDSLKCASCKEVLYGGLPPKWETEAYFTASKKLVESLKSGHSKICPWPSNPSPASFLEVPLLNHSDAEEAFLGRVLRLRCLGASVPAVHSPLLAQVNPEEQNTTDVISQLVTRVLGKEPTSDYRERIGLVCLLAVCGWSRSSSEQSPCHTISCEYCRRNVGLWNFSTSGDGEDRSKQTVTAESPEPVAKRLKLEIKKGPFDPIGEHHRWCPWTKPTTSMFRIRPASQASKEAEESSYRPAWEELLVLLQRRSSPEKRQTGGLLTNKDTTPPSQAWKVVRRIANFWQSRGLVQ